MQLIKNKSKWSVLLILMVISSTFLAGCSEQITGDPDLLDESYTFFDDSYVHEVELVIDDDNWYTTLYKNHQSNEDPYVSSILKHEDVELYIVGVRFKGSSSIGYTGNKKSFKIDVNEFFENCNIYDDFPECDELKFYGLKKLNFNNGFKDPSFMREKLFFDIAGNYLPTVRTVFTELTVNEESLGLYTAVEQPDDTFIEMNFGNDDGNLFECERLAGDGKTSTFGSDMSYIGENKDDYYDYYELKFGDKSDAWDNLIHLFNVLDNYEDEEFIENIENIADVDEFLSMLALNNIFSNYDSYSGSQHNYYLYEDSDGIFHPLFWDGNEAFGSFSMNAPPDQLRADIFYGEGVLETAFFNIPKYKERYIEIIEDITSNYFNVEYMNKTITDHADLIRDSVYRDTKKMYSEDEFESALYYSQGTDVDIPTQLMQKDESEGLVQEVPIEEQSETAQMRKPKIRQNQMNSASSYGLLEFVEIRSESIKDQLDEE